MFVFYFFFFFFFPYAWTVRHMGLGIKNVLELQARVRHEAKKTSKPFQSFPRSWKVFKGKRIKKKHPLVSICTLCTSVCLFRRGWPESLLKIQ